MGTGKYILSTLVIIQLILKDERCEHDFAEICRYGYTKNASITARGAGTGLLGQSLIPAIATCRLAGIVDIGNAC